MDRRRPDRGGRRSRSGRDCPQRAHARPDSLPGGTDFLSAGIHGRRTWRPHRVCVRVRLLVCRPERVLLGERRIVIVPGHVSVGERVCIRAGIPVDVRVPEHQSLVRLPDSDPDPGGLAYLHVPDADAHADADHIGTDLAEHTHVFGTYNYRDCVFGTARIHTGEHSLVRSSIRFDVAAVDERCPTGEGAPGLPG